MSKEVKSIDKLIDEFEEQHTITDMILLGADGTSRRIMFTDKIESEEGEEDGKETEE